MTPPPAARAPGLRACRAITRRHAKTFYFASHGLPRRVREHAYAVYAFCRWTDDGVDCAADEEDAARRLDEARDILDRAYGRGPLPAAAEAFRSTVRRRGVPRSLFHDLLDGMAMDLSITRYPDFEALDLYCHRVAGVVGLMMAHVFGFRDERCLPRAEALGKAMQLTNILRDVKEDHDRGRIYLPLDEMARFGVTERGLGEGRVDRGFLDLLAFQVARARRLYREADAGIPDLLGASSRLTVRVMGRLYEGILDSIERRGGDVFSSRAYVSTPRKLRTLASCQAATWAEALDRTWAWEPSRR